MADLIGQVTLLPPDLGGRRTPAYSGYCPDAKLPSGPVSFTLRFLCYDALSPGESDAAMIEVSPSDAAATVNIGDTFSLIEGTKTIGKVQVLENVWKQRSEAAARPAAGNAASGPPACKSLAPILGVTDIEDTIGFFKHLGFEVTLDHRAEGKRLWARLKRDLLEVQLEQLAAEPVEPGHRAARGTMALYIVTEDIHGMHGHCESREMGPSALVAQPYGTTEFELHTSDGWRVLFAQFTR